MEAENKSPSEILARRNVANIASKLKEGKTLTASERKALDEYESKQSGTEWVKDTATLARELGLSRQAIYDARSRFPTEAPAKHADGRKENLEAWRAFCAAKLIGKDTATKTLADLKAEMMRENIALLKKKNLREEGATVEREVVQDMLAILSQKLDLLLRLKLEVELGPRVAGKSAAEANVEGGMILDEIREVIDENIATFQREALAEQRDDEETGR